jgi:2-phospho-L-lactate guanylyltransferase (CobY/MobA/RfbA family)
MTSTRMMASGTIGRSFFERLETSDDQSATIAYFDQVISSRYVDHDERIGAYVVHGYGRYFRSLFRCSSKP